MSAARKKNPSEVRLFNLAKARKAKARKRKERLAAEKSGAMTTTVVPLDAIPTPPVVRRAPSGNGRRKPAPVSDPVELEAVADLIVAVAYALARRHRR